MAKYSFNIQTILQWKCFVFEYPPQQLSKLFFLVEGVFLFFCSKIEYKKLFKVYLLTLCNSRKYSLNCKGTIAALRIMISS